MKKSIFILFIAAILFGNCNNGSNSENKDSDSLEVTGEVTAIESEEVEEVPESKLKVQIRDNKLAIEQLEALQNGLKSKKNIKSLKELEKVLKNRDSLISLLNADTEFSNYMEEGDRFYQEFKAFGIHIIEAEGLFFGLDKAPLLEQVIEKVADEPYKLKNKIENLHSLSFGSEYPYYDISEEMEIIPLAEKMLTKYPGHKYNKQIVEIMSYALTPLVDFHKIDGDSKRYIVGGYDVNEYPGGTDISFHQKFAKESTSTKYKKIVNKIINSISTLSANEFDVLYIIKVPELSTDSVFADDELNQKVNGLPEDIKDMDDGFKYMWLGIDIPHVLSLRNGDETEKLYVYRFFDKKVPAEKALEKIKQIIPRAELIEYQLTETDKKHRN